MKKGRIAGITIIVILLLIQFIRIDKTNPPVDTAKNFADLYQTPDAIKQLLQTSCYDCHSNETKYPAYSNVAPISWVLKNHVNEGRKHLNFSEFGDYNENQKIKVIQECIEVIEEGEMPMKGYVALHKEAQLSAEDQNSLVEYFNSILNIIKNQNTSGSADTDDNEEQEEHENDDD